MRVAYYPTDILIRQHVKYISFYKPTDEPQRFMVFPNPGAAITLYKNHSYHLTTDNVYCTYPTPGHDSVMLQVNRIDPVKVVDVVRGVVVTIVFHPLGVSHFLPLTVRQIVTNNKGDQSFIPLTGLWLDGFAESVFEMASEEDALRKIEDGLLAKFKQLDIPYVEEALSLLTNPDKLFSISEICRHIGTSPRNLARLFNRHICLSPQEFRNIYQFRYSFEKNINQGQHRSFKDIVYESRYSHSSHMVRMYKKYTGLNPSSFFSQVAVEANYAYVPI